MNMFRNIASWKMYFPQMSSFSYALSFCFGLVLNPEASVLNLKETFDDNISQHILCTPGWSQSECAQPFLLLCLSWCRFCHLESSSLFQFPLTPAFFGSHSNCLNIIVSSKPSSNALFSTWFFHLIFFLIILTSCLGWQNYYFCISSGTHMFFMLWFSVEKFCPHFYSP